MRLDDNIYEQCAIDNINNNYIPIRLNSINILYSSRSLNESKKKYDKNRYLTEADILTYPTDKFSRTFLKSIAETCNIQSASFGPTLNNEYFVFRNGVISFDDTFDPSHRPDIDLHITALYSYIDNDIAGRITYRIFIDPKFSKIKITSDLKSALPKIIKTGDYCGYNYITHMLYDALNGLFIPEFVFESKFQTSKLQIADKLYHIAPLSLKDKILKYGIVPKSKSSNRGIQVCHPDRVYMFNLYDENLFKSFCKRARKKSCGYSSDLNMKFFKYEYAIFEIDRNKISDLILFRDNNFESKDPNNPTAVYSYTNIPSTAINFVKEFNLK